MIKKRIGSVLIACACFGIAVASLWAIIGGRHQSQATTAMQSGEATQTTSPAEMGVGPSGLPLPRFVSLKADKVNVRKGPSSDHAISWVFQRKGLPVEIIAESENWRRVRDSDGEEGWVLQSMLTGKRTAVIAPWRTGNTTPLRDSPAKGGNVVALLQSGVLGNVKSCDGAWCEIDTGGYDGYVQQDALWGVYPSEQI